MKYPRSCTTRTLHLPFEEDTFDVVVFDSTLTHVPGPERALAEAFRVLRPSGYLAAFDGDYATTTIALRDYDTLQTCVDAMMANSVHDWWLGRRLPALVRGCGFEIESSRSSRILEYWGAAGGAWRSCQVPAAGTFTPGKKATKRLKRHLLSGVHNR